MRYSEEAAPCTNESTLHQGKAHDRPKRGLLVVLPDQVTVEIQIVHNHSSLRLLVPTSQEAYGALSCRHETSVPFESGTFIEPLSCLVRTGPTSSSG